MAPSTTFSMTGFGRSQGRCGLWSWGWELRSVNARGLDVRLRLPPGFDSLDAPTRARLAAALKRGSVQAGLAAARETGEPELRINTALLQKAIDAASGLRLNANVGPARLDGLLTLKGVVETVGADDTPQERASLEAALLVGLDAALAQLTQARAGEGAALREALSLRVARIDELTAAAEAAPGRTAEAVKARLARAVEWLGESKGLDPARLHQEAVLLAARADIREELDRLKSHCAAARALLEQGEAIGRRLDFLAQEFGREANTLCAKSNDPALTAIGLDIKVEVEQFREQAQNVE